MEVKVNMELTLDERKALMLLCEVLDIKELVQSDEELVIKEGYVQKRTPSGGYSIVDERADLFAALRNVANCICPNCEFRSDDYITHYDEGDEVRKHTFNNKTCLDCGYFIPQRNVCWCGNTPTMIENPDDFACAGHVSVPDGLDILTRVKGLEDRVKKLEQDKEG